MSEMLEKILSNENIRVAKKRVYANKGANGVDGVTVQELDEYMAQNWEGIKQQIRERRYRPQPVLRVEIQRGMESKTTRGFGSQIQKSNQKVV
jgi:retron-type reverse transcriptase